MNNETVKTDTEIWLRLPRPGSRCPVTNLSRSTLNELVRPCPRNGYAPPVEARLLKRLDSRRGVVLISRESLLRYLSELPPPESANWPAKPQSSLPNAMPIAPRLTPAPTSQTKPSPR